MGQENPELNPTYLAQVMPYWFFVVPVLLGSRVRAREVGGYEWERLPEERLRQLRPVDIAETKMADEIVRRRDEMSARYGAASNNIDLEGPANDTFILRGPDFYLDLLADPAFARHCLAVVTETICLAYRFVSEQLGPIHGFPLANCNVNPMGPRCYADVVRPYDIRCVEYAAELAGKPPACGLHHCSYPVHHFATAYAQIPGLHTLQASQHSDITQIREVLPDVAFSAMIDQVDLTQPLPALAQDLERCLAGGVHDLAIWEIDPRCGPRKMGDLLRCIVETAGRHGREARFSVLALTWEELDWQFPRYRGTGYLPSWQSSTE